MSLSAAQVFKALQTHSLAKEGAIEEYPWEDVAWKVGGKIFAVTGKNSPYVSVKTTHDEQAVLVQHPNIEIAKYVGRFGWITIHVTDKEVLNLAKTLIDGSYESVRPKRKSRTANLAT